jgi:hypothetical protein
VLVKAAELRISQCKMLFKQQVALTNDKWTSGNLIIYYILYIIFIPNEDIYLLNLSRWRGFFPSDNRALD